MNTSFRSKIIKIGNSRGIRIPHTILKQAGLTDEVEMTLQDNKLVIVPVLQPRQGWSASFADMARRKEDTLLDPFLSSQWDDEEWTW